MRGDDVLHRVAGAQVVDDRRARLLEQKRLREERGDEVARNEFAGAVDEEAAVGVAVPRDADVGLLPDDGFGDVAAVLFEQRVGFVIGKGAVDLETQARRPARQPVEDRRRGDGAGPAAGIEDDVERLDD